MSFLRRVLDAYHRQVVTTGQVREIDRRIERLRRRIQDDTSEIGELEASRERLRADIGQLDRGG